MVKKDDFFRDFTPIEQQMERFQYSDQQWQLKNQVKANIKRQTQNSLFDVKNAYEIHRSRSPLPKRLQLRSYVSDPDLLFQITGLSRPFRVMTTDQAQAAYESALQKHALDFSQRHFLNGDIQKALTDAGAWNINFSGLFQALAHADIRNTLTNQKVIQRFKRLLGEDLVIWRSQYFHKPPQSGGTFWHQTGTFQETSIRPKLVPPETMDPGSVQLTLWIALTESKRDTAAMRVIPGSFADDRMEWLFSLINQDPLAFASTLDEYEQECFIFAFYLTPGNFIKCQFVVEYLFRVWPDYLADYEIVDLEMEPGEAVIFTSLNMHASYGNSRFDRDRLALAARFTTPEVRVYPNQEEDQFATPMGNIPFSLEQIKCLLVNGSDRYGFNRYQH